MVPYKTKIDTSDAGTFLSHHLHTEPIALIPISDGEVSQAYYFTAKGKEYVFRVNKHGATGYFKDRLVSDELCSPAVPIPHILEVGTMDNGLDYAISERAPGKPLDEFSSEQVDGMMPDVIAILDAIHTTEPFGDGYGRWDMFGQGRSSSWREELLLIVNNDSEQVRSAGFYDAELHERLQSAAMPLIESCPNERKLLHGDFGFNNVISDGTHITGVIDWAESAYGDPLRDVAWLDFWGSGRGYADAFEKYYEQQQRLTADYRQRIACYKLVIGLSSLCFFARIRHAKSYRHASGVAAKVLGQLPAQRKAAASVTAAIIDT